jgi:hypothetical protein
MIGLLASERLLLNVKHGDEVSLNIREPAMNGGVPVRHCRGGAGVPSHG